MAIASHNLLKKKALYKLGWLELRFLVCEKNDGRN